MKTMKKICLIGCLLLCWMESGAQKFMQIEDKAFDFGAKVGFAATFPIVNSLMIDGNRVDEVNVKYRVGYMAALFCRVNIDRFFIQPSLIWHKSEGDLYFNLPYSSSQGTETNLYEKNDRLKMTTRSLEMPVMIGYSLVKKGPYGLSVMAGPKFKYDYKVTYESELANVRGEYTNNHAHFGVNIATGVGVSIWRLFFDFAYEFGLNQTETDFRPIAKETADATDTHDLRIDKRTNVMSFSLGFLF